MGRLKNEDVDTLAQMLAAEEKDEIEDVGEKKDPVVVPDWQPMLNPMQREHWNDHSDIAGMCGPKFSGKTIGCLHVVVRHCYLEWDALYWILGSSAQALSEGPCSDLTKFVLPTWREGNLAPPYLKRAGRLVPNPAAGSRVDAGIGLEYSNWRFDAQTKHPILRIKNRFGGWSRIRVISIPHPDMIDDRVRGPAPSGVYLEEATKCKSNAYYVFPSLQLYRRRDIEGPQQYQFTCNPDDPENWVHDWMYKDVVVAKNQPGRNWPNDPDQPGIRRQIGVSFRFVPYEENAHNVSQKNRELMDQNLKDPILRARLYEGKWMSYPSGEALFKNEFSEARHMRGDAEKNLGLLPLAGYPIVMGYDLGARSVGVSFQQIIETDEEPVIMIFDELCYSRQMIRSGRLAHGLVEKLRFWNDWLREQDGNQEASWSVWHVAGDDATTMYRPNSDSVDAKDIQDQTKAIIDREPQRYRGIEPFHLRGCPRPPGSKAKRTSFFAEAMLEDRFLCSQICTWHRGMLFHQEGDPDEPGVGKKSKWTETLDASTYPSMYRHLKLPLGFYDLKQTGLVSVTV